jgi:hypothetical protein
MQTNTIESGIAVPWGYQAKGRKPPEMKMVEKLLEEHERFR